VDNRQVSKFQIDQVGPAQYEWSFPIQVSPPSFWPPVRSLDCPFLKWLDIS
jgi:hypothetical protein